MFPVVFSPVITMALPYVPVAQWGQSVLVCSTLSTLLCFNFQSIKWVLTYLRHRADVRKKWINT